MTTSTTPETDHFWKTYRVPYTHAAQELARKLERERDEARRIAEQMSANCNWLIEMIDKIHASLCTCEVATCQDKAKQCVQAAEKLNETP